MQSALREMLTSRLFFSDWAYRARIKAPVELAVGAGLAMGGKVSTDFLREATTRLGQNASQSAERQRLAGARRGSTPTRCCCGSTSRCRWRRNGSAEFVRKAELDDWLKENKIKSAEDVIDHFAAVLLDGQLPDEARGEVRWIT